MNTTRKINIQVGLATLLHSSQQNQAKITHFTAFHTDKRPRDRDLEYKNYGKKSKVRDRSSSEDEHKDNDRFYEKPRYGERDSIRRGPEKERRFGDWKEMISKGSGKKYYYNERDKSSQWEKPDEWAEFDM